MRAIKFRGWDDDHKQWRYGHYYEGVLTDTPISIGDCRICRVIIIDGLFFHVDPLSVGQFTGLKDSDGLEIYEGDFVDFTYWWFDGSAADSTLSGEVVYLPEQMSFGLRGVKNAEWIRHVGGEEGSVDTHPFSEWRFSEDDFHVTGNAYSPIQAEKATA